MKIGMFSERAAETCGSVFYRRPDGSEVEVTDVGSGPDGYLWDDKVVVGEVIEFVRPGRRGLLINSPEQSIRMEWPYDDTKE